MWRVMPLVLLLVVGCADPEPVAVPDLVGMTLDEAREAADDFELEEVDATGRDRMILSAGNWIVEEQDPDAGTAVEPGASVTLSVLNVRDVEDEPEPDETDETDEDLTEPDPGPAAEEPRDTSLEADVSANPLGLRIVAHQDVHDCKVDLNPGLIRSGYTTRLAMLVADEAYTVPWGDLTDRDGQRFDYSTHRPEMVTITCDDEDGGLLVDSWSWD